MLRLFHWDQVSLEGQFASSPRLKLLCEASSEAVIVAFKGTAAATAKTSVRTALSRMESKVRSSLCGARRAASRLCHAVKQVYN